LERVFVAQRKAIAITQNIGGKPASTRSARERSAGAITVFIMVWLVFPSLPAIGTLFCSAGAINAGTSAATLGVKLM
jgi:hypothetical protein